MEPRADDGDDQIDVVGAGKLAEAAMEPRADDGDDADEHVTLYHGDCLAAMEPRADDGDDAPGQTGGLPDHRAAMEPRADDGDDQPETSCRRHEDERRNGAPC